VSWLRLAVTTERLALGGASGQGRAAIRLTNLPM
jgi:hypothetical protein